MVVVVMLGRKVSPIWLYTGNVPVEANGGVSSLKARGIEQEKSI
jgi:hypothetical protein